MHSAAVLLSRTPQSWLESEAELEKLRAEHPDDPQTALMWASHLYARLVLDLSSVPAELEPQIEALVFQALPHVRANPMLALAAAKLLCFVSHGHLALAEALAEEAFARSTAFASAFAVLGQLRLNRGRLWEAIEHFDQGIGLAEPGSEFQVFLMVLKCTTLLALDDRQACLAASEALYRAKPLTRMQMGLFLCSPDEVLPDDLRQILLALDADMLRRLLAHFEYLFVRRVPDAAGRGTCSAACWRSWRGTGRWTSCRRPCGPMPKAGRFDKPPRLREATPHDFPRRPHFADYYHHSWNGGLTRDRSQSNKPAPRGGFFVAASAGPSPRKSRREFPCNNRKPPPPTPMHSPRAAPRPWNTCARS